MKKSINFKELLSATPRRLLAALALGFLIIMLTAIAAFSSFNKKPTDDQNQLHVITFYDGRQEKTVVSGANDVAGALQDAEISVSEYDAIRPAASQKLEAAIMVVNINRARPVTVIDGHSQIRVITPAQDKAEIAAAANVKLYAEDAAELTLAEDLLSDGAGLAMNITRAKIVNLRLFGQDLVVRTMKNTVAELLNEKKIQLGADDGMNLSAETEIVDGMSLHIWRNGVQTVTATEEVPFTTKTVADPSRKVGYREVQVRGQNGQKTVIYEVEMRDGAEVGRKIISEVLSSPAVEQVEIVGTKSTGGLTKSKGVNTFMDSGGVVHRETYYDLEMGVVMRNCGQGGHYTVRDDGVKVDRDGYVIIAAHLGRYPRCTVVETSLGLGKVYDTGGFVSRHPDGWDIATDWTNYNGR